MTIFSKLKNKFAMRMGCSDKCGHTVYRFHFSCLFCRTRRQVKETRLDRLLFGTCNDHYDLTGQTLIQIDGFMPKDNIIYYIVIDNKRKGASLKNPLMKILLEVAEFLAN